LILTQDGFKRQYEALDIDDLTAARDALCSLQSRRYLLLFNCGIESGCSRLHKHLQIFPAPDSDKFAQWLDADNPNLPSKAFMHRFQSGIPAAEELLGIYRALLRRSERALGHAALEGEAAVPHNVIMDRNWLVVIPRRAARWDGLCTNAAGMLGMVWVRDEEHLKGWLARGPSAILAQLGVPADSS
jgi:ATP adenylyltransferase